MFISIILCISVPAHRAAVTFNEAAHVVRTAVSARPHVDYFMIVDLGSRDDSDKWAALAFEVRLGADGGNGATGATGGK